MRSRSFRYGLPATVIAVLIVLSGRGPSPAYALEETITAIKAIKTVHFKADFIRQGPVECWMRFPDDGGKPTHICLLAPGSPLRKVDSPAGSFTVNTATNCSYRTRRDERRQDWYLDFANFFTTSLKAAQQNDKVEILERVDADSKSQVVVVRVDEGDREVEYLIDPATKRPVQFSTTRMDDFKKYFRKTIAVRSMNSIEYNQAPPEGIFDVPQDAQEVATEHDIIVHQGVGMPVGELTEAEACEKIVREIADALNRRDWKKASRLLFPFGPPPKEMRAQLEAQPDTTMVTIDELGVPTKQGDYWRIRCKSTEAGGKVKDENIPVKFFEIDGKRRCMVMWPD